MDLAAFVGISVLVIVTPGQDTALTIRNSLLGGRRPGIFTALGVSAGQAVWALATSVGLAAYAVVADRLGDVIRRPAIRRAFDAVLGAVLVALGLRLAADRR